MEPPKIRVAQAQERDRVMAAIMMGFSSDPLGRWFYPGGREYLQSGALFDAFGGAAIDAGAAFVSEHFEGAALWLPPGCAPDEERVAATLEHSIPADSLDNVLSVFGQMDEYHPEEAHWYLPLIGVDPFYQGQGIGSALMKAALRQCDDAGLPAYLESSNPRNISLYERHGFEVMGQIQVGTSPIVTPMYRQAQPS